MRTMLAVMLSTVALAGCECMYGGPGCGNPTVIGLCAPIVQINELTTVEVAYGDDTGLHGAEVAVTRISDPAVIGAWPGTTTGSLTLLGLYVDIVDVELTVEGWERPGVIQFQVTADPPPTCEVDRYADGPSFMIDIAAP